MEQIESLRLADALDGADQDLLETELSLRAASELRRLLSEALRIEALHAQAKRELFDARQLNRALLDALCWIDARCPTNFVKEPLHGIHREMAHDAGACARAAIAKATGAE